MQKHKANKSKLQNYLEEEAELGSDNEENDNVRKQINKDDQEEDEEGLDEDLAEFIDFEGEMNGNVEPANEEIAKQYMEQEKLREQEEIRAVINNLGNRGRNKKRTAIEAGFFGEDADQDEDIIKRVLLANGTKSMKNGKIIYDSDEEEEMAKDREMRVQNMYDNLKEDDASDEEKEKNQVEKDHFTMKHAFMKNRDLQKALVKNKQQTNKDDFEDVILDKHASVDVAKPARTASKQREFKQPLIKVSIKQS